MNKRDIISISGVSKHYLSNKDKHRKTVFSDFSILFYEGEIVSILGKNGSGKTTLMKLIAGIENYQDGKIECKTKNLSYLFQNFKDSLLPWNSVINNILFSQVAGHSIDKDELESLVHIFGLTPFKDNYTYELSGGQQQRVAIVRAIIHAPQLLILDEPFSAMDYTFSRTLWSIMREFCKSKGITVLMVSHDIDSALYMSDRIVVLKGNSGKEFLDKEVSFGSDLRGRELITSYGYNQLKKNIISSLE